MKKLIVTLLAIAVLVFVGDRLIGKAMWVVNQHTNEFSAIRLNHISSEADEDVIFIGTSRCEGHYVPSVIADTIGMRCYNAGISASNNIFAQYATLNILLNDYAPKVIVLEVGKSFYAPEEEPFGTISFYSRFFGNNKETDKMFKLAGIYNIYRWSHTMRYNSKAPTAIADLFHTSTRGMIDPTGYSPYVEPPFYPKGYGEKLMVSEPDSLKMLYMKKFIDRCRENHVFLVLCASPRYSEVEDGLHQPLRDISQANGVPFLDYESACVYLDHPEYFRDANHLWDKGARIFSAQFAHELKTILAANGFYD